MEIPDDPLPDIFARGDSRCHAAFLAQKTTEEREKESHQRFPVGVLTNESEIPQSVAAKTTKQLIALDGK
jgi:hypothetical protein